MTLVKTGLQVEVSGSSERQRLELGEQLKSSITNFTVDFIPHMDEEEEVGRGQRLDTWVKVHRVQYTSGT